MILQPYSYNATSLNSTDYVASFPRANSQLQMAVNPSYIKRAGASPVYAGKDFQPVVLNLEIIMQHDTWTLFESLNQLFDTKDETPRQFICQDVDYVASSDYVQYYVYATPKSVLGGHDGTMATVTLALDDPIWQSVTQNSQTFSTTASTSSTDVTTIGNDYAYPVFEITPSSGATQGYNNTLYLQVLPTSAYPWNNRFLDITGSSDTTFDTAALVGAAKMQADGDDLRVFRDGVEISRWLNGINTTDTHVIVNDDMPAAANMTLLTALGAGAETTIAITYTAANYAAMYPLPQSGRLIIDASLGSTDTEEFTYTTKTMTDTALSFTINARAARNTTAIAHAAGQNVRFLPHDFTIVYGNSSATAPVTDDTKKPIVALTSRNNSFTFTNFYSETAPQRPHSFYRGFGASGGLSGFNSGAGFFSSTNDAGDTDPATAIGLRSRTFQNSGVWRSDTVNLSYGAYFADGIASIVASGEQYQTVASIPITSLYVSGESSKINFAAPTLLWSVSAQATTDYSTWTTWSKASTDATVPSGMTALKFEMAGSILGDTDYINKVAISSLTVGLTNYPHVMIRSELTTNLKLDLTITNETMGESIRLIYPLTTTKTLYVDCDPDYPTVKFDGQMMNGAIQLSTIRAAWLRFQPGSNTIGYQTNNTNANDISIVMKWRDRANFY